jgi:antitoxin (DNA-binding transcriptional repressor) of toxin-antitoxin stability system
MTVTIEEAKKNLDGLIAKAAQGEAIVITAGEVPVAQLVSTTPAKPKPQYGSCKGKLIILAEDDEHLKDFEEYMP